MSSSSRGLSGISTSEDSDRSPIYNNDNTSNETTVQNPDVKRRTYAIVVLLILINALNYMDRFTLSGVLVDVQKYYSIGNSTAGFIQTLFIIFFMISALLFGYLGDRYNRKIIICVGILIWLLLTLSSSFIGKEHFWAFILIRAAVGIGEASYSTVAPNIIADLFDENERSFKISAFYCAIPVGSGLGFWVGSQIAKVSGAWQWAFRVTPAVGFPLLLVMCFVLKEPRTGHARRTCKSYGKDLKELAKTWSFVFSTFGFTCVAFVTGTLAFWTPFYMYNASKAQGHDADEAHFALIFGMITGLTGFIAILVGGCVDKFLKKKYPQADPLVCGFGLLACGPFLYFAILFSKNNLCASWVIITCGVFCLSLNWAITTLIMLDVVHPSRRSAAQAVQILVSHFLGDAGSPYLIGLIADQLASEYPINERLSPLVESITLQNAFYIAPFVCVIGSGFFLATTCFIENDKETQEKNTKGKNNTIKEEGIDNTSMTLEENVNINIDHPTSYSACSK